MIAKCKSVGTPMHTRRLMSGTVSLMSDRRLPERIPGDWNSTSLELGVWHEIDHTWGGAKKGPKVYSRLEEEEGDTARIAEEGSKAE